MSLKWNEIEINDESDDKVNKVLDTQTYHQLKSLCQRVADIIVENYNPHTQIIINTDMFKITQDITNGFLDIQN